MKKTYRVHKHFLILFIHLIFLQSNHAAVHVGSWYEGWISDYINSTSIELNEKYSDSHSVWRIYQPVEDEEGIWNTIDTLDEDMHRVAVIVHGHCTEYLLGSINALPMSTKARFKRWCLKQLLTRVSNILPKELFEDYDHMTLDTFNTNYGLRDTTHLARILHDKIFMPDTGKKRYDAIIGYNYLPSVSLDTLGNTLAYECNRFLKNCTQVDLFGYSMGGVVARYALEQGHLLSKYPKYGNLITFGSPHMGIPWRVLDAFPSEKSIAMFDLFTSSDYISKQSHFLEELNGTPSPYKEIANYYTIAGNKFSDLCYIHPKLEGIPHREPTNVGIMIEYLTQKYIFKKEVTEIIEPLTDGLVPIKSAMGIDVLREKSDRFRDNLENHTCLFNLNHRTVVGSMHDLLQFHEENDGCPQCLISDKLQQWISSWYAITPAL